MRNALRLAAVVVCGIVIVTAQEREAPADPILGAMTEELERSRNLRIVELDEPYYIQYGLEDARTYSVRASLGAVIGEEKRHFRVPTIEVRVGGYDFDNTNFVFSDFFAARATRGSQVPLDNDKLGLRNFLWLGTDRAYKGAVEAIARKRAALKNVTVRDDLPDFSKAEPVRLILAPTSKAADGTLWTERIRRLSGLFAKFAKVMWSEVDYQEIRTTSYLANSEGTLVRLPDDLWYVRIRAEAQASDGMIVRDSDVVESAALDGLPSDLELERTASKVAENVTALAEAPVAETYVGPVLFEGESSPQLFAQLLGGNLAVPRRPVPEPGRAPPFVGSELESRLGSRILPGWMNVVDDPTQKEWRGRPLLGHYQVDMEGVRPTPVSLVENGLLKAFLLTRQPIKGHQGSNGRARLPGRFGAKTARFGNLFVGAAETSTAAELRRQLTELCVQQGKPFGLIVRKLDFPSSASAGALRRMAGGRQRGTRERLLSAPTLLYRLYPDGREELVRGLRFRGVAARSLRDILAASDESHLFEYLGNSAPLSMMGAGGFVAASSVVAPGVLFEDLELERVEEELPNLPVVPPPQLVSTR